MPISFEQVAYILSQLHELNTIDSQLERARNAQFEQLPSGMLVTTTNDAGEQTRTPESAARIEAYREAQNERIRNLSQQRDSLRNTVCQQAKRIHIAGVDLSIDTMPLQRLMDRWNEHSQLPESMWQNANEALQRLQFKLMAEEKREGGPLLDIPKGIVFPRSSGMLAPLGPLPDDLESAFNAAIFCSTRCQQFQKLIVNCKEPTEPALSPTLKLLADLWEKRDACRETILPVFNELTSTRTRLPKIGSPPAANAHWLALELTDRMLEGIWKAVDFEAWTRCLLDPNARMDLSQVKDKFKDVRRFLRGWIPIPGETSLSQLSAQIQIEAARAAEARKATADSAAHSPATTERVEGATPPADPYADLRRFARDELKGQERAVIEALCDAGGELPIADLAVKDGVAWDDAFKGFESVQTRLNRKIKKLRWKLRRGSNAARLTALPG